MNISTVDVGPIHLNVVDCRRELFRVRRILYKFVLFAQKRVNHVFIKLLFTNKVSAHNPAN